MVRYYYNVKWNYLKTKSNNAYSRAKIEDFGFSPVVEDIDGFTSWTGAWAKKLTLPFDCTIGKWIRGEIEQIYKSELKKEKETGETSTWLKSIRENGYEFDEEGHILENDASRQDVSAELCVFIDGPFKGTLFINVGALVEIYDSVSLTENAPKEVEELLKNNVIYKKKYVVK